MKDIDLKTPWRQAFSPVVSTLDVFYFFRHILGRVPSETEWPGHCGFVGKDLQEVVATYLNSPEFKNRKLVGFAAKGIHRVELGGYVMYVADNDYAVGNPIYTTRNYEPGVSAIFRQHLKPGMTAIDIGANI